MPEFAIDVSEAIEESAHSLLFKRPRKIAWLEVAYPTFWQGVPERTPQTTPGVRDSFDAAEKMGDI